MSVEAYKPFYQACIKHLMYGDKHYNQKRQHTLYGLYLSIMGNDKKY